MIILKRQYWGIVFSGISAKFWAGILILRYYSDHILFRRKYWGNKKIGTNVKFWTPSLSKSVLCCHHHVFTLLYYLLWSVHGIHEMILLKKDYEMEYICIYTYLFNILLLYIFIASGHIWFWHVNLIWHPKSIFVVLSLEQIGAGGINFKNSWIFSC